MRSFTQAIIDIIASTVIILALISNSLWLKYLIIIYSIVFLIIRLFIFIKAKFAGKRKEEARSRELDYILYLFNAAVLFAYGWFLMAALWGITWALSLRLDWKTIIPTLRNMILR
jgi:hypothetical protein